MATVRQEASDVPVMYDVDVAVAGAGIAGMFAAIAAARMGMKTVVADRFGDVGGNLGPGMIAGGGLTKVAAREGRRVVGGERGSLVREFRTRFDAEQGGRAPGGADYYLSESSSATYVLRQMAQESGVSLLLSVYVADPILHDRTVRGFFVESKSGRGAIRARLVIDATGDADLARRAGAPVLQAQDPIEPEVRDAVERARAMFGSKLPASDMRLFEDQLLGRNARTGVYAVIANVEWARYEEYTKSNPDPSPDDLQWYATASLRPGEPAAHIRPLVSLMRRASLDGHFRVAAPVGDVGVVTLAKLSVEGSPDSRLAGIRTVTRGILNSGDAAHISRVEVVTRDFVYELARFFRRYVPGFEHSYLAVTAPFLGARGGPSIRGEITLSAPDYLEKHRKFPDVMYIHDVHSDSTIRMGRLLDVPYRIMVPIELDGLLATGRSAAYRRQLRTRIILMHMGQAAGTAAALAVKAGVQPRHLDIKDLQRHLLEAGFYLGDEARLRELGVA